MAEVWKSMSMGEKADPLIADLMAMDSESWQKFMVESME
jgi:hypothetical protein